MERKSTAINPTLRNGVFIHFLDIHHLELISHPASRPEVILEAERAILVALLASKKVYIPAASFFESRLCAIILKKLRPIFEYGLICLVGSAPTLRDYWQLRRVMYHNTEGKSKYYGDLSNLPPIPYLQMVLNLTKDIAKGWDDVVERTKLWELLAPDPSFEIPKDIENKWIAVPERIGSAPFVEEHVAPLIFNRVWSPIQSKIISQIINNLYFSTYTNELRVGIIQELVLLETNHTIVSYGPDIYYKPILERLRQNNLLKDLNFNNPLSILDLKDSECWIKTVIESNEYVYDGDHNLRGFKMNFGLNRGASKNRQPIIGIITIREDEYKAVVKRLPGNHWKGLTGSLYYRSNNVVVIRCIDQGEGEAQTVAWNMINDLQPMLILLVGIAGALPEYEFTLGDVIVSSRIVDMCVGAALEGGIREGAIAGGPLHKKVNRILRIFPTIVEDLNGWNTKESLGIEIPDLKFKQSNFYGGTDWEKKVKERLKYHFPRGKLNRSQTATSGAIASSDNLVKDTNLVRQWKNNARHIVAVEMEAAGVYRATYENDVPFIAIRGISDIVGFNRGHEWTSFACNSAAAFATYFIMQPAVLTTILDVN